MKCLVTGAAGFIGSHLCEHLLALGHDVAGVDAFLPTYPRSAKERNLGSVLWHPSFSFREADLRREPLEKLVADIDVVYHLAAAGPCAWSDFEAGWSATVLATQRLLDAVRAANKDLKRFVLASSSSVYGNFASGDEGLPTRPVTPYGIAKLAAEQVAHSYADAHSIPVVTLRYYSVYGPRQRPDMACYRFIQALLAGEPVAVHGDGQQARGSTYVADAVEATILAADAIPGEVYNVGGAEAVSVWDVLRRLEAIGGRLCTLAEEPARPGDLRHALADTAKIRRHLGWKPATSIDEGLARQWRWQQSLALPPAAAPVREPRVAKAAAS
jgi:nucleoside-diphosphate-sugar epimerase